MTASIILAAIAIDIYGAEKGMLIGILGMFTIILIFGEILPKSIVKNMLSLFLKFSGILIFITRLFMPISFLISRFARIIHKWAAGNKTSSPKITEEEIKLLVDIGEKEGTINKTEKELLYRSLDFNDIIVGEILTHRLDMVAVEVNQLY